MLKDLIVPDGPARRVSVIGAGMIGCCSALWLQRRGFDVTIIDPNPPGSGCSYGNAGCLSPASIVPMSLPGVLRKVPGYLTDPDSPLVIRWGYMPMLAPWLWRFVVAGRRSAVEKQAKALNDLLGLVYECLNPLIEVAGASHLIRQQGMLYTYRSRESLEGDALAWDLRRRNGIIFERLSGSEIVSLEPCLSSDFVEAVFVPGNGHVIDPQDLVIHFASAAVRAGARLIKGKAQGFELVEGRLRGVRVNERVIIADSAVIACGAHSKTLAAMLGDRIPLDTERGYHVMIGASDTAPKIPVMDAERKFIVTPMRAGLRVAGIVEFAGFDQPSDTGITNRLLSHARDMLPTLGSSQEAPKIRTWMGFRPSMPDSLPVIGRALHCRDVIYAFGHGHVGMCGGPSSGKLVSELVAGEVTSIDIAPFRPDRF